MGVGPSEFREGKVENSQKNCKNAEFPRALKGKFYRSFLNGKNIPHFTILTPNTLFDSRIESENYVFEGIFKQSLKFEPLPSLISGPNPKLIYVTLCVLN